MNFIRKLISFLKYIILKILIFFGFNSIEEYNKKPHISETKDTIKNFHKPADSNSNSNIKEIGTIDGIPLLMDKQGNTFVKINGKLVKYHEYLKQKEKELKKVKEQEKGIEKNLIKFTYKDFVNKIKEEIGVEAAQTFAQNLKNDKIDQNQTINQNKLKELVKQTEKDLKLKNQELEKLAEKEKMLEPQKEKAIDKTNAIKKEEEMEKLKNSLKNTFHKDKEQEQERANEQKAKTNNRILQLEAKYGRDLDGDGYVNGEVAVGKQKYNPSFTRSVEKHENMDLDGGGVGKNSKHLLRNQGRSR